MLLSHLKCKIEVVKIISLVVKRKMYSNKSPPLQMYRTLDLVITPQPPKSLATDPLKAVIVDQVRTMMVDQGTEGKSILEAVPKSKNERQDKSSMALALSLVHQTVA